MLFNTYTYGVFLVLVYFLYRALDHKRQNLMLLAASFIFYGAWSWRFLGLLLLSIVVDFYAGRAIHRSRERGARRRWLLVSIIANLGVLGVFKYYDFFATSLAGMLSAVGVNVSIPLLQVVLPVGISFYTFQTMTYTIDIYRGTLEPADSILDFALFVAFFPQLVAGPIERASHLLGQLVRERQVSWRQTKEGLWLILLGLFKKAVIADTVAVIADRVFNHAGETQGVYSLIGVYAFALQIYGDFAGYSDIARGSAKLFGVEVMLNFDMPYLATNPQAFWRRWHISLSTWLRDYLYIPLGGNRRGGVYRNLLLTMVLGGLWHGAAAHFVIWGAYHGLLLALHRRFARTRAALAAMFGRHERLWWAVCVVVMFHLTCAGWILFRASSMSDALAIASSIGQLQRLTAPQMKDVLTLAFLALPLMGAQLLKERSGNADYFFLEAPGWLRANAAVYCVLMVLFWSSHRDVPFIYFQF